MRNANALVVMVKPPVAGMVKTRLVPPLTFSEASTLYNFFIKDIFASVSTLKDIDVFAAVDSSGGSRATAKSSIPDGVVSFDQAGPALGERLYNVFERLFGAGYSRAAVIGSDSPDLDPALIEEGFALLANNRSRVVLGPALDGGYYLIAMDSLDRRPFEGIPWSTGSVLDETIKKLGGSAILLPPWYDIDTAGDILKLLDTGAARESVAYLHEADLFNRVREYLFIKDKDK